MERFTYRLAVIGKNMTFHTPPAKGVAALGAPDTICDDAQMLGATWLYQWWTNPAECPGVETVAMISNESAVGQPVTSNSQYLLLFNEPDLADQANLSIPRAVKLEIAVEGDPQYAQYKLVSPVPSQLAPDWLPQFRAEYQKQTGGAVPRWNAISAHCYFVTPQMLDGCIELVRQYARWATDWAMPDGVWLTEFSAASGNGWDDAEAAQAEQEFIDTVTTIPQVHRIAHFTNRWEVDWGAGCPGCEKYALVSPDNALTALGEVYAR